MPNLSRPATGEMRQIRAIAGQIEAATADISLSGKEFCWRWRCQTNLSFPPNAFRLDLT
jgi:hypothetical protein